MRHFVLVVLCVLAASPAAAQEFDCRAAVSGALQSYGIAEDRVTSTRAYNRVAGGGDGVHVGYRFWMRMKECDKGYLIVDTDFVCNVEQTYTDGPCKIPGVPDC